MNKSILVFLLTAAFIVQIKAQNTANIHDRNNSLGIAAGYYRAGLLDKTLSPLLFTGNGLTFSAEYVRQTTKSLNRIELQFVYLPFYPDDHSIQNEFNYISYNETETYQAYPWGSINAIISYEYLRKISFNSPKMSLFIGGISDNFIQVIYPRTWIISYSIGPKGTFQYSINEKHNIATSLQFPMISMVERPPYATWNNDIMYNPSPVISRLYSGKIMLPNHFFYTKLTVVYQYAISEKWSLSASYKYSYFRCKKTREYTSIINTLNIGIHYKF